MKYTYILRIKCEKNIELDLVSKLLNTLPTSKSENYWELTVIEEENNTPVHFISYFLNILEGKYDKLKELGIERNSMSVWKLYEYDQQCNMEFSPEDLKRLGVNGITLCISCWES